MEAVTTKALRMNPSCTFEGMWRMGKPRAVDVSGTEWQDWAERNHPLRTTSMSPSNSEQCAAEGQKGKGKLSQEELWEFENFKKQRRKPILSSHVQSAPAAGATVAFLVAPDIASDIEGDPSVWIEFEVRGNESCASALVPPSGIVCQASRTKQLSSMQWGASATIPTWNIATATK